MGIHRNHFRMYQSPGERCAMGVRATARKNASYKCRLKRLFFEFVFRRSIVVVVTLHWRGQRVLLNVLRPTNKNWKKKMRNKNHIAVNLHDIWTHSICFVCVFMMYKLASGGLHKSRQPIAREINFEFLFKMLIASLFSVVGQRVEPIRHCGSQTIVEWFVALCVLIASNTSFVVRNSHFERRTKNLGTTN